MIIGFTGTQEGMTDYQKAMLVGALARLCPEEFHHGDCIGADADAHEIVRRKWPRCSITIHPPKDSAKRAFCEGDVLRTPKPYLVRNMAIVIACEELICAPKSRTEELRSGTWMTIRAARRLEKKIHTLWPN